MKRRLTQFGEIFENDNVSVFFGHSRSSEFLKSQKIQFGHQVHKADLIEVNSAPKNSTHLTVDSDGLWTLTKNLSLGVYTADCLPCFINSKEKLFSLHLGWRSLQQGLLEKALCHVSTSDRLDIFIGPHIGSASFEVGPEVFDAFSLQLADADASKWSVKRSDGKYTLSLKKIVELKTLAFKTSLHCSDIDTYTSELHSSYRRQNKTRDRNISFAFLK